MKNFFKLFACLLTIASGFVLSSEEAFDAETILHRALVDGTVDEVRSALEQDISPSHYFWWSGYTPLMYVAGRRESVAKAKVLLEAGAHINTVDIPKNHPGINNTALMSAVRRGDAKLVSLYLDCGAEVEQRNSYGFSPLDLAATSGNCFSFGSHQKKKELLFKPVIEILLQKQHSEKYLEEARKKALEYNNNDIAALIALKISQEDLFS